MALPPLIEQLVRLELISASDLGRVRHELSRGASLWSALSHASQGPVWAHLARSRGLPYYANHLELKVLFADLFSRDLALTHQIIPHRTRNHDLQVITYTPENKDGLHPDFPDFTLRHALVTPDVWRRAFHLCYPAAIAGPYRPQDATALVTLTPLGQPQGLTPEQAAEIHALTSNLRYINLSADPIDEDAAQLVTPPVKALTRSYPHHLEGSRLVVMMQDPTDVVSLSRLRQHTQREILPAISTAETISYLLEVETLT